jgi:hypothetical protein
MCAARLYMRYYLHAALVPPLIPIYPVSVGAPLPPLFSSPQAVTLPSAFRAAKAKNVEKISV